LEQVTQLFIDEPCSEPLLSDENMLASHDKNNITGCVIDHKKRKISGEIDSVILDGNKSTHWDIKRCDVKTPNGNFV
jgi:hypothetical protein